MSSVTVRVEVTRWSSVYIQQAVVISSSAPVTPGALMSRVYWDSVTELFRLAITSYLFWFWARASE